MVTLCVGAHPDDIEFGCMGTLKKWSLNLDEDITFVIFTHGENSGTAKKRSEEAKKSSRLVNAKLIFLDYKDGYVEHNSRSVSLLREQIEQEEPDIVFSPFFNDTHQDHMAVSRIVLSSVRQIGTLLFYETPSTIEMSPNYYIDITEFMPTKLKALKMHSSQNKKMYFDLGEVEGLASYRAWQCYRKNAYYEAFQLFRSIK